MSFVRRLWVYGEIDLEKLRAAKEELALDYKIKPHEVTVGGWNHRVLAWGARPPFLCDYLFVTDASTIDDLMDAVAWALHERDDPDAMTVEDQLAGAFGPGVREIPPEELEAERKLAAYEAGTE